MSAAIDLASIGAGQLEKSLTQKKVWVDLDNSPHVPFFRPILEELGKRGCKVLVTARDAYQVRELLEFYGVPGKIVGHHHGKHKVLKALGTVSRSLSLARIVRREMPDLSVSHGSRSCLLTSVLLGIPNLTMADYEFTAHLPGISPTWLMIPSVVPVTQIHGGKAKTSQYPGIKEDVYLSRFKPDFQVRARLGISSDALLITVRPPATEAHYHNPESDRLFTETLNRFVHDSSVRILILPRNKRQEADIRVAWAGPIASGRIVIPTHVEDGLNLIWNSDLVVSGGGTMNREAAAMGVPVYSIFRGHIGAVDNYLADQGRLVLIESPADVKTKIKAVRREWSQQRAGSGNSPALDTIVRSIALFLESPECSKKNKRAHGNQ